MTSSGFKSVDPEEEMADSQKMDLDIELAGFLGDGDGWDVGNVLDNIGTPSLADTTHADLHDPNSTGEEQQQPQQDPDFSTSGTLPTNENKEPDIEKAADPIPVEVRAGVQTGHPSGQQIIASQGPALQNNIIPHIALIPGQPGHNQFPAPNVYGSNYAPNYMQNESSTPNRQTNSFTPLLQQGGHAIGMHSGLQSQSYSQATHSAYPNPEPQPQAHLHSAFVPVPSNSQAHQHGYSGSTAFVPAQPNPQVHQQGHSRPIAPTAFGPMVPNPLAHQQGYNRPTAPTAVVPAQPNLQGHQQGYNRPTAATAVFPAQLNPQSHQQGYNRPNAATAVAPVQPYPQAYQQGYNRPNAATAVAPVQPYPQAHQQGYNRPTAATAVAPVQPYPQAHQQGYNRPTAATASVPVQPNPQAHQQGYNRPTASTAVLPVPPNPQIHQQGYNRPSAFVPVASNPNTNQQGYIRPQQPVPAANSVPPVQPNYHPQSRANPTTYNFFGPTYSVRNVNQTCDRNIQATLLPGAGGNLQQGGVGSLRLPVSQGVPEQVNVNNLNNTPNIQRQSNPLHEPIAPTDSVLQIQGSRNSQCVQATASAAEGSSSDGSNSASAYEGQYARLVSRLRAEEAAAAQGQEQAAAQQEQVAPAATNAVTDESDKGKIPESPAPSLNADGETTEEALQRILDMNPGRIVIRNPLPAQDLNLSEDRGADWIADLRKHVTRRSSTRRDNEPTAAEENSTDSEEQEEPVEKPRRGRPPKRRGPIALSFSSEQQKVVQAEPSAPTIPDETPQDMNKNEDQNAKPASPSPAFNEESNAMFDPAFATIGLHIDPFLRFSSLIPGDEPSKHGGST